MQLWCPPIIKSLNIQNFVPLLLVTLTGVKAAFTYQRLLAETTDAETYLGM